MLPRASHCKSQRCQFGVSIPHEAFSDGPLLTLPEYFTVFRHHFFFFLICPSLQELRAPGKDRACFFISEQQRRWHEVDTNDLRSDPGEEPRSHTLKVLAFFYLLILYITTIGYSCSIV